MFRAIRISKQHPATLRAVHLAKHTEEETMQRWSNTCSLHDGKLFSTAGNMHLISVAIELASLKHATGKCERVGPYQNRWTIPRAVINHTVRFLPVSSAARPASTSAWD